MKVLLYMWIVFILFCLFFINRCYCSLSCLLWARIWPNCSRWCALCWYWRQTDWLSLWPKYCRLCTLWRCQCSLPDHSWVQPHSILKL